jgi:hypothetical protein
MSDSKRSSIIAMADGKFPQARLNDSTRASGAERRSGGMSVFDGVEFLAVQLCPYE